jgi:hypothetical protein
MGFLFSLFLCFCKVNIWVDVMGVMGIMGWMGPMVDDMDDMDKMDAVDVVESVAMVIPPFLLCCLGAGWAGPGNGIPFLAFTI